MEKGRSEMGSLAQGYEPRRRYGELGPGPQDTGLRRFGIRPTSGLNGSRAGVEVGLSAEGVGSPGLRHGFQPRRISAPRASGSRLQKDGD